MAAGDDRPVSVERLLFLRSLATRLDGPEAIQIAAAMHDVYFKRGEQLFGIGEASGDVFFVVRGSVTMSAPGAPPWEFDAPAVVGALDSFAGRPRARRGVATSDVHALALSHTDWLAVLEEHHEYACETVQSLAGALSRMRLGLDGDGGFPDPAPDGGPLTSGLNPLEKMLALRRVPLLRAAGAEATLRLCELAEEVELGPGGVLFREGDPCDALHAVAGGVIVIERASPPLRAAFGPGAIVGGAAAMGVGQQPFEARARPSERAVVLQVRKDDVLDVMEDHFGLARSLLGCINAERDELMRRHGTAREPAR